MQVRIIYNKAWYTMTTLDISQLLGSATAGQKKGMPTMNESVSVVLVTEKRGAVTQLQRMLDSEGSVGMTLVEVPGLEEVIALRIGYPMDAVVVDMTHRRPDVLEKIRWLAKAPEMPPLVVITANGACEQGLRAVQLGAQDFIDESCLTGRLLTWTVLCAIQRQRSVTAWNENQERYQALMDQAVDGVFIIDNDAIVREVSPSICAIFGVNREHIIGKNAFAVLQCENRDIMSIEGARTIDDDTIIGEHRIETEDGQVRYIEFSAKRLSSGDYHGWVRDITGRKSTEERLTNSLEQLRSSLGAMVNAMAHTVEVKDPYTAGHQRRVANLARAIATEMGMSAATVDGIRMAGVIHDLGKLSVPAEILSKPTRLSDWEFRLIKEHPQVAYDILSPIEFPWPVADIVFQHHERMDGSGYPLGLTGDDILPEARVIAVADVVEAMASHRPYRAALGTEVALQEIENFSGERYDPVVVDACLGLFRDKGFVI